MAAYLALIDKTTKARVEGKDLIQIDADICAHLGVEVDEVKWYRGWMDNIGFSLAVGKSFPETREHWIDFPDLLPIIDYLAERYDNASYIAR
jgi:hypothetical protein